MCVWRACEIIYCNLYRHGDINMTYTIIYTACSTGNVPQYENNLIIQLSNTSYFRGYFCRR